MKMLPSKGEKEPNGAEWSRIKLPVTILNYLLVRIGNFVEEVAIGTLLHLNVKRLL